MRSPWRREQSESQTLWRLSAPLRWERWVCSRGCQMSASCSFQIQRQSPHEEPCTPACGHPLSSAPSGTRQSSTTPALTQKGSGSVGVHDSVSCANGNACRKRRIPPFSTRIFSVNDHEHDVGPVQSVFTCLHPPRRFLPSFPQPRRAQNTDCLPLRAASPAPPPPRPQLICAIAVSRSEPVLTLMRGFRFKKNQDSGISNTSQVLF